MTHTHTQYCVLSKGIHSFTIYLKAFIYLHMGFPGGSVVKNLLAVQEVQRHGFHPQKAGTGAAVMNSKPRLTQDVRNAGTLPTCNTQLKDS